MDKERLKITYYLACAIEQGNRDSQDWKVYVKTELSDPTVFGYDPIELESIKTGKNSKETCDYIGGLKRGGHKELFHKEMDKIWWGQIVPPHNCNKVALMQIMRNRAIVDGNYKYETSAWGDIEAVVRSNFIIAYMEKNVKTVGTIREIAYAEMFNIPVYLILPDQTKTECNSTLLDMVEKSGGNTFYSVKDCVKYIKEVYNIS